MSATRLIGRRRGLWDENMGLWRGNGWSIGRLVGRSDGETYGMVGLTRISFGMGRDEEMAFFTLVLGLTLTLTRPCIRAEGHNFCGVLGVMGGRGLYASAGFMFSCCFYFTFSVTGLFIALQLFLFLLSSFCRPNDPSYHRHATMRRRCCIYPAALLFGFCCCLSACLYVCLSVCLYVRLSVCLPALLFGLDVIVVDPVDTHLCTATKRCYSIEHFAQYPIKRSTLVAVT